MSNEKIRVRNTVNGQIQEVRPRLMDDAHFNKYHVLVDDEEKSFDPELYTPKTADEYKHVHKVRLQEPAVDDTDDDSEDKE